MPKSEIETNADIAGMLGQSFDRVLPILVKDGQGQERELRVVLMEQGLQKTSFTLLAAGQSARMKIDKALLDFQGRPWIFRQVEEIKITQVINRIVIVDRPEKTGGYQELLGSLSSVDFEIEFVENYLENSSPSDSVFCSFQAKVFPNGSFVSPIDVPLQSQSILKLWQERNEKAWVLKPSFQGHGGHPVWLSSEMVGRFRSAPKRLDEFLAQQPIEKLQFVDVPSHWTQLNLNTPQEWKEFITDLQGRRET